MSAADPFAFLGAGGGSMAKLIAAIDWSKSPLGAPAGWPPTLKTTLAMLLSSRHPMFLFWGPELFQFYNDAYRPSFGEGKHPRAMGQRGVDCWPEIWPIIGPQIDDVMKLGTPSWNENQLVPFFRNGGIEEIYWTYGYSPVFDERGDIVGTLVVCTETTTQVKSLQSIERSQREAEAARNRLTALFETAPAFVCTLRGPEHVFEMVNQPYQRLIGVGREVIGKPVRQAVPEAEGQGFFELLDTVYRTGEPFIGRERQLRLDRTGTGLMEDAFLTFVYQPRLNAAGEIDGIDVFGFDVTEQIRSRNATETALNALRQTEEEFRSLAAVLPEAVWTVDALGRFSYMNEAFLRLTGLTPQQASTARFDSYLHPDDLPDVLKRWAESTANGSTFEAEHRVRTTSGTYRWHLSRASSVRDQRGSVAKWVGISVDIEELRRTQSEQQRRVEFEQQLIGIVSHDLRNPISAMLLAATALMRREETDARAMKALSRIISSGERANRMIHDLLDFTQARMGHAYRSGSPR